MAPLTMMGSPLTVKRKWLSGSGGTSTRAMPAAAAPGDHGGAAVSVRASTSLRMPT